MPNVSSLDRPPRYRRHNASGQALVTIHGKDHYLGKYKWAASLEAYKRLVAEWIEVDGRLTEPRHATSVSELILAYLMFVKSYLSAPSVFGRSES